MGFSAFGAIGAAVGSLLTNKLLGSKSSGSDGFDYDAARKSMELQQELYDYKYRRELEAMNSAHQREVTDLRSAGLNPILSATGGSGLNSPTGSMPDISSVNSAITASRQADRQLKANTILGLLDAGIRAEANSINSRNATASTLSAEASLEQARAASKNAESNALETASKINQRNLFENPFISAQTKKVFADMNLMTSQYYLNSALAEKASTDAWYSRQILPYDIRAKNSSGGIQGTFAEMTRQTMDLIEKKYASPLREVLHEKASQGFNSAKSAFDNPSGLFPVYKGFKFVHDLTR